MTDQDLKNLALNPDINLDELDHLSDDERNVLISMINELQSKGDSDILKSLWYQDYEEIPVDIDTFIDSPEYLGDSLGSTIYPFWRKVLRKLFKPGAKYYECALTGAIGIGKSTIADIGIAYMLYKLLCMKNPQSYYGLTKSSIMTINFFNVSLDLSYGVAYSKLQSMLINSPWFRSHGQVVGSKNEVYIPGKGIQMVVGSKEEHALGQDVFCLIGTTEVLTESGVCKIEDLVNQPVKVFQYNNNTGLVELSDTCTVKETGVVEELIDIELEDGSIVSCTPDHLLMLTDGTYKMAKYLQEGDDIMSINDVLDLKDTNEEVKLNKDDSKEKSLNEVINLEESSKSNNNEETLNE